MVLQQVFSKGWIDCQHQDRYQSMILEIAEEMATVYQLGAPTPLNPDHDHTKISLLGIVKYMQLIAYNRVHNTLNIYAKMCSSRANQQQKFIQ